MHSLACTFLYQLSRRLNDTVFWWACAVSFENCRVTLVCVCAREHTLRHFDDVCILFGGRRSALRTINSDCESIFFRLIVVALCLSLASRRRWKLITTLLHIINTNLLSPIYRIYIKDKCHALNEVECWTITKWWLGDRSVCVHEVSADLRSFGDRRTGIVSVAGRNCERWRATIAVHFCRLANTNHIV